MGNYINDKIGKEIIEMFNSGMNINQIRLYYNNKPGFRAVKTFLQKNGIVPYENIFQGYTIEECNEIGMLYIEDKINEIYDKYPSIKQQTIYEICSHFNFKKSSYFWSEKDTELLKKHYGKIKCIELSKMMDNRHSIDAIHAKALKMGLGRDPYWSDEENNILIKNYSFVNKEEMSALLPGRTQDAIMNHAQVLGLKSFHYLNEKYTDEQKQFIIDNWQSMTDQEIADVIGKTARGVMEQRNIMNLYRIRKDYSKYENIAKFFRGHIQDWKIETMKKCDYKCIFTGSKDFAIHHIYGFNAILDEAFREIEKEIPIFSNDTSDYSVDQLNRMLEIFDSVHNKYPLGVCVRKDIHNLFHRIYGSGGNNQEQWDKFYDDFKSGIYDEMI